MTAARDELQEALVNALRAVPITANAVWPVPLADLADAMLPHAERFAAEQVAAALNDAADDPEMPALLVRAWLRARAAAVLAAPDNDRRQG